jgi:hypothetical protein
MQPDDIFAKHWKDDLQERNRKEVELAQMYENRFNHGTSGHLAYTTMAIMAKLLDHAWGEVISLRQQLEGREGPQAPPPQPTE